MIVKNTSGVDRYFRFAAVPDSVISPGTYVLHSASVTLPDTNTALNFIQADVTAGNLTIVSGGPSESAGVVATPFSVDTSTMLGLVTVGTGANLPGVTALVCNQTALPTLQLGYAAALASISVPNITTMPGTLSFSHDALLTSVSIPLMATAGINVNLDNCAALASFALPALTTITGNLVVDTNALLTTLSLPLLATVSGTLGITSNVALTTVTTIIATATGLVTITGNTALTSLDLRHLITAPNGMTITGNTLLATLNLAALVPTNAKNYDFSGNALPAAQVNAILARFIANAGYVSGTIDLSGGTNAAPTGQGATDAAALGVRGATVTTN